MCGQVRSKVLDSRPTQASSQIRRRRECLACQARFTTHEVVETAPLLVIKRDGKKEEFSREKLVSDIRKASEKRPISTVSIERMVDSITAELSSSMLREIPYQIVGDMVLEKLLSLDKIAYIRFSSVYKDFKDPRDFLLELEHLFNLQIESDSKVTSHGEEP